MIAETALLSQLTGQTRAQDFLRRAVEGDRVAHAYLFMGAAGSGKLEAAWALAQALLCEDGGCGTCDSCERVARHTHPDVHFYAPESATGYLISQTRELLEDVGLAPIRARRKVYILDRAEQMRANTANALLKTIEEPPRSVTFILLGTSCDLILPTIVSRCQCVPFRSMPLDESAEAVHAATGSDLATCRMAIAVAGGPTRAVEFLHSLERQAARRKMLNAVNDLFHADEAQVLSSAKELTGLFVIPKKEREAILDEVKEKNADFLSRGALKQLEDRTKRELTAREHSGIMEALASVRSLLRDVLLILEGDPTQVVNEDVRDIVDRLAARATTPGVLRALEAVSSAERRIARNITPQLTIEVMLFDIRKALLCP